MLSVDARQAKEIADDVNNRINAKTNIQKIEELIYNAANKGCYAVVTPDYESAEASRLKNHFKNLGFKVSKIKLSSDFRFSGSDATYYLDIEF
jgi:hypothetical protein